MATSAGTRALTIAAASFLAFDGVALVLGGVWLHRAVLIMMGAVLIVGSLLVGSYWRWHRQQVAELGRARQSLAGDARDLQDLVRRN